MSKAAMGDMRPTDHGVVLQWRDITYSVTKKKKDGTLDTRVILDNLSGDTSGGSLLALMGPSGSGKTSLLNALAFRVPKGPGAMIGGAIYADGKLVETPSKMARMSAYVEQEDALFALSTVRETLMFAAQLRLSKDMPLEEKEREVNNVIADLGLVAAADTIVGNEQIRGISGGERKRVAIGMDLLHDPRLIFMDEPTSGLDAFQALNVMSALKDLAIEKGRTIIASVHQPRSSIYALIDQLVLLSGGRLVYAGAGQGACSSHFAALGEPVPKDFNPADHFLDIISVDYRTPKLMESTKERIEKLAKGVAQATVPIVGLDDHAGLEKGLVMGMTSSGRGEAEQTSKDASRFWIPFKLLLARTWREQTRDTTTLTIKYVMQTFFSLLFGVVYLRMARDQTSIQDRTGILFFQAMNQAFGSAIGISKIIPQHLEDHPAAAQGCEQGARGEDVHIWLREISFIRYAFQALCVNEFKGAEFSCDGSTGSCVDGDEHLERLKFDDITISGNCGILAGMILGFNLLALGIVYYRQPKYLALEKKTQ